jgi:tetratricopeptide (TPR) repeat protein
MGKGPLEDPRLREIEAKLNEAQFDEAQQLLATLTDRQGIEAAAAYFATRLLYQRGRLDNADVVERLRDVLSSSGPFPQAENMLAAAEFGVLESSPEGFARTTQPPFLASLRSSDPLRFEGEPASGIPRAPALPNFSQPARHRPWSAEPSSPEPSPARRGNSRDTDVTRASPAADETASFDFELSMPPPQRSSGGMARVSPSRPPSGELASTSGATPAVDLRRTAPVTRSAAPDAVAEPSLLEISNAIDTGDPHLALDLLARRSPPQGADSGLLSARAWLLLGDRARARRELEPVLRAASSLAPELRVHVARLLLELGSPETALDHARAALDHDPDDPNSRLTYAWALVRVMRRSGDPARSHEVETLIATTPTRSGPLAALALSLRAALLATRGPATRALNLAQAALRHDPKQPDALATVALASIRLGLREEADRALGELRKVNPDEAGALTRSLTQSTLPPPEPPPRSPSGPPLESLWGMPEAALVRGDPEPALTVLERACEVALAGADRDRDTAWTALGRSAAALFTEQPVFRHFAPYDSSVFSIQRLAAAIDLVFGERPRSSRALVVVLGAYVGESIRQAYGGEWGTHELGNTRTLIHATGLNVNPCELVERRLVAGEPLLLPRPKRLHPGADPFGNSVPLTQSPPCPWDPEIWPAQARLAELARAIPSSVIGLHCRRTGGRALDHSQASLDLLDRYLDLLAPPDAPLDPDSGWARRAALLAGAHLGQVLVVGRGARWHTGEHPDQFRAYRVDLPGGAAAHPCTRVHDRLSAQRVGSLSDYYDSLDERVRGQVEEGAKRGQFER